MLKESLKNCLNEIREISSEIYSQYVPIIESSTDISVLANAVLNYPNVQNEFMSNLSKKLIYTAFETKRFNNPLKILEGDEIPLGYAGEEIFINPANGRRFNVDDFAGLLTKYEADVKVQYTQVNMDLQYPVTITRAKLKSAFTSWENLDRFITEIANSLYNGAYIDEYMFTKGLVTSAYNSNRVQVATATIPSSEATGKAFVKQLREAFLNMQLPSRSYNAWAKVGGEGRPVTTWTEANDIVLLIRNDILTQLDVDVLSVAFNMSKTDLLGRIIPVDDFSIYSTEDGSVVNDGSNIYAFLGDRRWFKVRKQDEQLDEFYNANNRTWQYYLNITKMYNYSLFANGVVFASEVPSVNPIIEDDENSVRVYSSLEDAEEDIDHFAVGQVIKVVSTVEEVTTTTLYVVALDESDEKELVELIPSTSDNG